MGHTYWTTCQTCRKDAPDLGDCGFVGFPSLSTQAENGEDSLQPFGYIYEGFLAVGIDPVDMHEFHVFLRAHEGHNLRTFSDQDPEAYSEDSDQEDSDSEDSEEPEPEDFGMPPGFGIFFYDVHCPRCDESFRTEAEACLREGPGLTLTSDRVALFQSRVRDTLDDNFYHSEPFGYDDLDSLCEFFEQHASHGPTAKLVAGGPDKS